jgi:hypothetical protein
MSNAPAPRLQQKMSNIDRAIMAIAMMFSMGNPFEASKGDAGRLPTDPSHVRGNIRGGGAAKRRRARQFARTMGRRMRRGR